MAKFDIGQIVSLKSNLETSGVIINSVILETQVKYKVFINNSTADYFESQLVSQKQKNEVSQIGIDSFHTYITSLQITNPSNSKLY